MKKLALLTFAGLGTASAFAQEAANNIDLSVAGDAATDIATSLKDLLTGEVLTGVLMVVGASLAVWAVIKVVGWIRKGAK